MIINGMGGSFHNTSQAVNKQKRNQLGNIIPLMNIKNMIHDKNNRKTQVIWIKIL